MPRETWSAELERRGCQFVKDADGLSSRAELWRSPEGKAFLVPYFIDEEVDATERRVVDYSLKRIVASLGPEPVA